MARYFAMIDSPRPLDETFEYVAEFANTQEWDPGVVEAESLVEGPVGLGSFYRVVARFLGRNVELRYEVTAFEPSKRIVLEAHTSTLYSHDEIRFEGTSEGSRVSYDATLELKGFVSIAEPLLDRLFQRIGDQAVAGLREALSR